MTAHKTHLGVDATVFYVILDATPDFPVQVDIRKIIVNVGGRKVNILGHFDESTVLSIEDEISETLSI
jgi:hypothetical protein